MRSLVMSIRPPFALAAYRGAKLFEYRRVRVNARPGDRVLVYESRPTSKVTGEFRVGRVIVAPSAVLAELEPDPQLRDLVRQYLQGASTGTALEISNPTRWHEPLSVDRVLGTTRSPVSYAVIAQ
jgi:predicted transcriptional regulator